MGINADVIADIGALTEQGRLSPGFSVVELGAQQLAPGFFAARAELVALYSRYGAECPFEEQAAPDPEYDSAGRELLPGSAPPAREFWTALGCSYASVDIDGSPGAIPLDLNVDDVPQDMRGRFDLCTNYGTTEHVCNQLNALKVMHDLTRPGGVMIHSVPAQGMLNHGLVNYNPKFFWMLARSNGYDVIDFDFLGSADRYDLPADLVDYIGEFQGGAAARLARTMVHDCGLRVVLGKAYDIEFVPPIDVNTGTRTDDPALRERYWTVFEEEVFKSLPRVRR